MVCVIVRLVKNRCGYMRMTGQKYVRRNKTSSAARNVEQNAWLESRFRQIAPNRGVNADLFQAQVSLQKLSPSIYKAALYP